MFQNCKFAFVLLLVVLLVLPEADAFLRRRRRRSKKQAEEKAPEATKTPGVCVAAKTAAKLVDNPDPKTQTVLGNAHVGEVFNQEYDVGGGFIVVKV